MDCHYVHERLTSLMFGELPAREVEIMKPHLTSCPSCLAEQETFRQTFAVVQTAVRAGGWVPDQFAQRVTEKLAPRSGRRLKHDRLNIRLARRALGIGITVLVGIALIGLCVIYSDHLPHWMQRYI